MTHKKNMRRLGAALLLAAALAGRALAAPAYLIPGGNTVGLKLYTKGLVITQVAEGTAAQMAGLREGDAILAADGEPLSSAQSLRTRMESGRAVVLTVLRGGLEARFLVSPEKTAEGYRLGVSLRDHVAGIGTVTYYDPETGQFGALGHGVVGATQTQLTPVAEGFVVPSSVAGIQKGSRGTPGMLKGVFDLTQTLGTVTKNCEAGVFGVMRTLPQRAQLPVAEAGEARTGAAVIRANIDGTTIEEYQIEILRLDPEAKSGRNLLLRVTDPALLARTGGIVQGMSGSPIIQGGKLIGAVTHVLVNDPTRGYGIFIENMLEAAG